jgi:hypothetical protein
MSNAICDSFVEATSRMRPKDIHRVWVFGHHVPSFVHREKKAVDFSTAFSKLVAGVGFEPTTFRL